MTLLSNVSIIDTFKNKPILYLVNKKYRNGTENRILCLKTEEDGDFVKATPLAAYFKEYEPELIEKCRAEFNIQIKKTKLNLKFSTIILASWLSGLPSPIMPSAESGIQPDYLIPIRHGTTFSNAGDTTTDKPSKVRILDVIRPFKGLAEPAKNYFFYYIGYITTNYNVDKRSYVISPLNEELIFELDRYYTQEYVSPTDFNHKEIDFINARFPVNSYVQVCNDKVLEAPFGDYPFKVTRYDSAEHCEAPTAMAKVLNAKNYSGAYIQTYIPKTSGTEGYSEAKVELYVMEGPGAGTKIHRSSFEIRPTVPKIPAGDAETLKEVFNNLLSFKNLEIFLNSKGMAECGPQVLEENYAICSPDSFNFYEEIVSKKPKKFLSMLSVVGDPSSGIKLSYYSKDLKVAQEQIDNGLSPDDCEFYFIIHNRDVEINFPEDSGVQVMKTYYVREEDLPPAWGDASVDVLNPTGLGIAIKDPVYFKKHADIYYAFIVDYLGNKVSNFTQVSESQYSMTIVPQYSITFIWNKNYVENRISKLKSNLMNIKNIHEYNKLAIKKWFIAEPSKSEPPDLDALL